MAGRRRGIIRRLNIIDRKLDEDDELIKRLGDVVIKLRAATEETEEILRQLQEDTGYLE